MPNLMRAIEISQFGGPDVLKLTEREIPAVGANDVLIKVHAAGVSRPDVLQRQGHYAPPKGASHLPGLEIAGVVEQVGSEVSKFAAGDKVCALVAGGGYAEFCVAPVCQVLPIPSSWSFEEAATLPENLFTVYDMLILRLRLSMGETILIHGGTSGIGSTAIMLARLVGAIPIATAGSAAKVQNCLEIGAEAAFNYKLTDWVASAKQFTNGVGVNCILDIVGGDYVGRDLDCIAPDGRIGLLATQGGSVAELPIMKLLGRRASIHGASMRMRTPELKGKIAEQLLAHVWPLLPKKTPFKPLVDTIYRFDQAADAHVKMESGAHVGKIVLIP